MRRLGFVVVLLLLGLSIGEASAHVAGPTVGGDSVAAATPLGLPARVFESPGMGVSVRYYRLDLARAEDVHLRLFAPEGRVPSAVPTLFVFGPELPVEAAVPSDVERANGTGALSFSAAERAPATVPALGARWTTLLDRTLHLGPGRHHLVLRAQDETPLSLFADAPGRAALDWLVLPGLRDDARAWTGAPTWPPVVTGAVGAAGVGAYAWRARRRPASLLALAARAGAAFIAASSLALAPDAARSGVGWALVAGGLASSALLLALAHPARAHPRAWQRAAVAAVAVAAFALYAGFLWGPLLAIAGALIPEPGPPARPG
ncbi:MAG TPA: hypothetical protein VM370_06660 [Candidatus Thermoplasmatota archaeon]|nr:hypothetical protein [Candidatus Thermoplasmatota archaeon]